MLKLEDMLNHFFDEDLKKRKVEAAEQIRVFEDYLKSNKTYKELEGLKSANGGQLIVSVKDVTENLGDFFLLQRDEKFLDNIVKILRKRFGILRDNNAKELLQQKRQEEINSDFIRYKQSLKYMDEQIQKDKNWWKNLEDMEQVRYFSKAYHKFLVKESKFYGLNPNFIEKLEKEITDIEKKYKHLPT